jgi:hypothetical protein
MLKSLCLFIAGCRAVCAQTITVTSSPNPATIGKQVTLTATVQGAGTAVFAENGQTIGTAPVVGGQAVLTTKPSAKIQVRLGGRPLRSTRLSSADPTPNARSASYIAMVSEKT